MIPNAHDITTILCREITHDTILAAMAFYAITGDRRDDISEAKAFSEYGKAWVLDRTKRGEIHYSRVGESEKSTKNYSRYEIEVRKRAEKMLTDYFTSARDEIHIQDTKHILPDIDRWISQTDYGL